VRSDPGVYRQILINLIANAIKHAPGSRVTISVVARDIASSLPKVENEFALHVSVADNGAGIPAKDRHLLFQPFQQVGQGSADPSRGSGLGLAICALLTQALGGEISLDAQRESGTSIQFWIRATAVHKDVGADENRPSATQLVRAARNDVPLRVLLVDDHEVNLRLLTEMLCSLGHTVIQAQSGEAAIVATGEAIDAMTPTDRTKGLPIFDVALMDLNLPGMSGFESVSAIRALCESMAVVAPHFIALTASTEDADRARAVALGMLTRITKPATVATLRAALDAVAVVAKVAADESRSDLQSIAADVQVETPILALDTLHQLLELERKSGNAFVVTLIGEYLKGFESELSAVTTAAARNDEPALRRAAHGLAGASLSVGARALADVLQEKHVADRAEWVRRLDFVAVQTQVALAAWCQKRA
jgi:CheY-like chemotaxis protein/HPt (histidine-containing phosphotransfer) domain-containing protein